MITPFRGLTMRWTTSRPSGSPATNLLLGLAAAAHCTEVGQSHCTEVKGSSILPESGPDLEGMEPILQIQT